ncbi:MAG TPA: hypothetical protein PLZ84_01015 [Clostridia bacterium]|nr:hypothetical protein [Clostridia bacterium]
MKVQNTKKTIVLLVVLALILVPMLTVMTGCKDETKGTATPAGTEATATPAGGGGPYQGVVLIGDTNPIFMSPYGFMSNHGTIAESGYFWSWNVYQDLNEETRQGCRYFTLPDLDEETMFQRSYYDEATAAGKIPYVIGKINDNMDKAPYGRAKNIPVGEGHPYWPEVATKVYFDQWVWDFPNKPGDGTNAEWVYRYLQRDLDECIAKIKAHSPNAEIYIGGVYPFAKTFPRYGAEQYPKNKFNWIEPAWVTGENPTKWKETSDQIKAYCEQNGYIFVDWNKAPFADEEGYAKEEYMTDFCHGGLLGAKGILVYGDMLMEAMGLPKPDTNFA